MFRVLGIYNFALTLFKSLSITSRHSKLFDFSQFSSLLSSAGVVFYFICCCFQKITVENFFPPKKTRFFHENGQKHIFLTNIGIFCFKYIISMLWEIFWGALHVCRSKIGDVENSFQIRQIFESPWSRSCPWGGYATQEADQELKWKLRTISVEFWNF